MKPYTAMTLFLPLLAVCLAWASPTFAGGKDGMHGRRPRGGGGTYSSYPGPYPDSGGIDTARINQDMKAHAEWELSRTTDRFNYFAQRLESSKNPRAAELIERIRRLLAAARHEFALGRYWNVRSFLGRVHYLFPELQRLAQELSDSEKQGSTGNPADSYKNQTSMGQAADIYRRVLDRVTRLKEQSNAPSDPKSSAQALKIQELLDKAKESLATGKAEASKEFSLRAERLLPEWHSSVSASMGGRLSPSSWQRLKAKMEKATDIVSGSGSEKSRRILEKAQEHFERAERSQGEGQTARAEVEMDIALKLAAKAVDIARTGAR